MADELPSLCTLDERFHGRGISGMDMNDAVLRGRPHGGLAVLWRKTLKGCEVVDLNNPRVMNFRISDGDNAFDLFNVYMPCDNRDNLDEFLHLLSYLGTAVEEAAAPYIAMIGDFNANVSPVVNTLFGDELKHFCGAEMMTISDLALCEKKTFTFYSEAHQSVSWLDHCVSNSNLHSAISEVAVLYDFVTSDHMPILVTFDKSKAQVDNDNIPNSSVKVNWRGMAQHELQRYEELTEANLSKIKFDHGLMLCDDINCVNEEHIAAIDKFYNEIVKSLVISGNDFQTECKEKPAYQSIPGWNEYCREVHSNARDAFLQWVFSGRPKHGVILQNMQSTRAAFKQAIRRCRASSSRVEADRLAHKLLMKDSKNFWKEIRNINGKTSPPVATTIGAVTGKNDIADLWRRHYSSILNSASHNEIDHTVLSLLHNCPHIDSITVNEVSSAIKGLKLDKASGLDSLSGEHFKFACHKLNVLLCLIFNCMISHGHVPSVFSDTILVPIIKDKKGNISDVNNYRPIALTSVASKILEKILLIRLHDYLYTTDNQFSFKAKHSTDMCIFSLKSVIDFYVTSSSPMYICYMDASKAFDKVNFWCLFDKLLKRNIPSIIIRFLKSWFCTQQFVVRWSNVYSQPFSVQNGVRQGGILSPLLFNVYLNDLSIALNNVKKGCIVNDVRLNHLVYADDLCLIAPSVHALQNLINMCEKFAEDNDIVYNTTKTVCMCIRPKNFKCSFEPIVLLSGTKLKFVDCYKYLGVFICCDQSDDTAIDYQRRNLYNRGNMLIRNFKHCNDSVKCQLFLSFCTSFYCAPLWLRYKKESLRRLKVAYNRIFRILLKLEHRISMSESFIRVGMNPFPVLVRKMVVSFRDRILSSDNVIIKAIVNSLFFTFSAMSANWNKLIFVMS